MGANFTKKQTLMYKNGYAVPAPMSQQEEVAAMEQQFDAMWTLPAVPAPQASTSTAPFTPKYVQFDKQVSRDHTHTIQTHSVSCQRHASNSACLTKRLTPAAAAPPPPPGAALLWLVW